MGNAQCLQGHALSLHRTLLLQHHTEVGVRLFPSTALTWLAWCSRTSGRSSTADLWRWDEQNRGVVPSPSFLHSQVQLSTILSTLGSFLLMQLSTRYSRLGFVARCFSYNVTNDHLLQTVKLKCRAWFCQAILSQKLRN